MRTPVQWLVPLLPVALCSITACTSASVEKAAVQRLEVLPAAPEVFAGETVGFTATLAGTPAAVTWSIQEGPSGGSITPAGFYTAPESIGQYHVIAASISSPDVLGSATVTVTATPVVQVTITPRTASLSVGGSVAFSASVTGAADPSVAWAVQEGTAGGTVSSAGVYTAPATPGTYHVVATSAADVTRSDTAAVLVTAPAAGLSEELAALATKRSWFAHQSTGNNIVGGTDYNFATTGDGGLATLLAQNPGTGLSLTQNDALTAEVLVGQFANDKSLGDNQDPLGKITEFDGDVRAYLAHPGWGLDLAFLKLCWIDFAGAQADTDAEVDALFAHYESTVNALIAAFPSVKFLHFTAPLKTATDGVVNMRRERYNAAMRATYPAADLFDIADWECIGRDGRRVYTNADGAGTIYYDSPTGHVRALSTDWDSDGGHLDAAGSDYISARLVEFLYAHSTSK